ncbi:MAG: transcriptional repressor [Anaerolineales bacterium]|nr:transcriptional repressor [Anaerolineales bacterium]
MSCWNLYAEQLRERGYRLTPQRMSILHVLHDSGEHLSPGEIFRRASHDMPGLTEPTVYRTLEFLAENDLVVPAHLGSGHLVYQITGHAHHHLVCRICGAMVEIEHNLLTQLYKKLEKSSGFQLVNDHVTFFGLCPECQKINSGGE